MLTTLSVLAQIFFLHGQIRKLLKRRGGILLSPSCMGEAEVPSVSLGVGGDAEKMLKSFGSLYKCWILNVSGKHS